jgi:hypothetical protein
LSAFEGRPDVPVLADGFSYHSTREPLKWWFRSLVTVLQPREQASHRYNLSRVQSWQKGNHG